MARTDASLSIRAFSAIVVGPFLFGVLQRVRLELRCFALQFIHPHSDATGVFHNAFRVIVVLTTSSNRVRHNVSSQDDAVAGLLGR